MIFLHRKVARKLTLLLLQNPAAASLPITLRKTPTAACMEVEGGVQSATARLAIQSITSSGTVAAELKAVLMLDAPVAAEQELGVGTATSATKLTVQLSLSAPLLPTPALDALTAESERDRAQQRARGGKNNNIPDGLLSNKIVSSAEPNRDILKELRAEISATIEKIGQEYMSLYPEPARSMPALVAAANSTSDPAAANGNGSAQTPEERKLEFLEFLTSNGIFHELKETLKPKVQLLIQERYGARGRALGKSQALASVDLNRNDNEKHQVGGKEVTEANVETVLSELYVFLLKECSLVLNSMFSDTIIDRDVGELEQSAYINDETETQAQLVQKLLRLTALLRSPAHCTWSVCTSSTTAPLWARTNTCCTARMRPMVNSCCSSPPPCWPTPRLWVLTCNRCFSTRRRRCSARPERRSIQRTKWTRLSGRWRCCTLAF